MLIDENPPFSKIQIKFNEYKDYMPTTSGFILRKFSIQIGLHNSSIPRAKKIWLSNLEMCETKTKINKNKQAKKADKYFFIVEGILYLFKP